MNRTKIPWADYTWNPITGCSPTSEGCANCYAQAIRKRFNGGDNSIQFHSKRLSQPLKAREASKIFVCSMGDLFHSSVTKEMRHAVYMAMENAIDRRGHTFIILTKRPQNIGSFWMPTNQNIWLGVTCENQTRADERIPILLQTPAAVRFVSVEPILGPVNLSYYLNGCPEKTQNREYVTREMALDGGDENLEGSLYQDEQWERTAPPLDWAICGPETGPNKRPFNIQWARDLRHQCEQAGVPFFYKGGLLDGVKHEEFP